MKQECILNFDGMEIPIEVDSENKDKLARFIDGMNAQVRDLQTQLEFFIEDAELADIKTTVQAEIQFSEPNVEVSRPIPLKLDLVLPVDCLDYYEDDVRYLRLPEGAQFNGEDVSGFSVCGVDVENVEQIVDGYFQARITTTARMITTPFLLDSETNRITSLKLEELKDVFDDARTNKLIDVCKPSLKQESLTHANQQNAKEAQDIHIVFDQSERSR